MHVRLDLKAAIVHRELSIARPSHRMCVVSQLLCVGGLLPSQVMCAGNGHLLRAGPFIIVRRYIYRVFTNMQVNAPYPDRDPAGAPAPVPLPAGTAGRSTRP